VAANVSAFNTVVTTDIVEPYIQRGRPDAYYVRVGRIVTVAGMIVAIGTALIASGYSNLMNYLQALFSIFNAPLFATFIIGMFWKRSTPAAGFWGLVAGTAAALVTYIGYKWAGWFSFGSDLDESFWGAGAAFVIDAVVTIAVTLFTKPKPVEELQGLVWGMANVDEHARKPKWWESPQLLGFSALGIGAVLTVIFW
jgi:SSS family solute:Na+ symporter